MNSCHSQVISSMVGTDAIILAGIEAGKKMGWCTAGDAVVCVHGSSEGHTGSTNLMRVYTA